MSLFTDLKEVLTPYAQRIKGLATANEEIKADLGAVEDSLSDATNAIKAITITGIDVMSLTNATPGTPKKLSVKITATQAGSGTPSPTNVRTISGKSAVNLSISDGTETDEHEISLGQTVYGGELDLISGVLTITEAGYDLSQLTWSYQDSVKAFYKAPSAFDPPVLEYASSIAGYYGISDTYEIKGYSAMTGSGVTYAMSQRNESSVKRIYVRTDGTNAVTPTGHAVFRLKEPITVQLTSEEIELFTGYNLITTEGNITLEYIPNYSSLFEEQAEIWDAINADDLTPYYVAEMEDTIEKVNAVNNEPALVFPLVTDIHRYTATVQTFTDMIKNIKHFSKKVKCDFLVNLGDLIEGGSAKATSLGYAYDSMDYFKGIGLPILFTEGNHDNNSYYNSGSDMFSLKECYGAFYANTKANAYNIAENGTDYYVDYDGLGIRVISLNACNTSVSSTYAYGASTEQWLINALDTDYKVVLLEHLSSIVEQVWNKNRPQNNVAITNAIQAFVSGGGTLIQLSGHSHVDIAFIEPWLSIMQVCQKFEKANTGSSGYGMIEGYIDELGNPDRTAETYTADAWSICLYKPISNEFDMIRFGAGVDRYFHVTPIAPTTVTSKLTGTLTWSTSDATVATVSGGVITGVGSGRCGILAKDADGNYECWTVRVN